MQHLLRIDSLEQVSKSTLQYSHASMVSLASIASSIKAIERRLSLVRMSSADDVYLDQSATSLDSSLNLQHVKRRSAVVFALGSSSASDCSSDSDLRISSCAPPGVEVTFREEITTQTIHEDQEVNDQVIEAGHQINVLHDICMLSDSGECVNSNMMEEAARSSRIWRRKSIVDAWIYSVAEDEKWQEVPDDLGISSLLTINEGILSNVDTRDVKELVRLWAGKISTYSRIEKPPYLRVPVFSRCHQLLAEGRRLENLTWRLMNREILCCQSNWLSERGAFVTKNADLQSKRQPQLNATLSQLESGLRQAAICDEDRTLIRRHSFDSLRKVGQGKGSLFTPRTNNNVTEIGAQNEGVPLTRVTTSSQSSDSVTDHAATTLFDSLTLLYPAKVAAYISKFQLAQKLEQQLSLLSLQTDNQTIQCHLTELSRQLERTKHSLIKVRERCLKEGHALYSIDSILSSCKIHDPATGLLLPSTNPSARHTDILALRRRALKESQRQSQSQSPSPVDVEDSGCMYTDTKRDTINKWLFKNLQSSPENAALHRLIMNCGTEKELDEKTWARLVVKYWSVDEAATGEEYCAFEGSTDEGVGDSNDCAKSEEVMMPWVAGREGEGKGRALKSGGFTMPKILERVVYGKVETSVLVTAVHFPVRRFGGEIEKRLAAVDLMMRVAARS